jgi:hypothetical protein
MSGQKLYFMTTVRPAWTPSQPVVRFDYAMHKAPVGFPKASLLVAN